MTYARVRDKKTGLERRTTYKSYTLIKHRYELLGLEDEAGNPVEMPQVQTTQKKREAVAPVVSRKQMSPEEIEAKKAELRAMNEAAIQKVKDEQVAREAVEKISPAEIDTAVVKEKKKPGPKPKNNAQA